MGWQSGGWGNHSVLIFLVEVEIVILDVGLNLKVEITFEELGCMMVQRLPQEGAHIYCNNT